MKIRNWVLIGVLGALAVTYVICFTEWLRPAPIEVASQVRFSVQPPSFGRAPKQTNQTKLVMKGVRLQASGTGAPGQPVTGNPPSHSVKNEQTAPKDQVERIGRPEKGGIDQAPGGVANVTFSLDGWYKLTRIRVEDVPVDGSAPTVVWQIVGKSMPLNSLMYGLDPEGMKPLLEGSHPEALKPSVPYRLIVEAGRRRGTNSFRTLELAPID